MPTRAAPLPAQRWKRNTQLAASYGITPMSLKRWKKDPKLNTPPSSIINNIEWNDDWAWDRWMQERTLPLAQQIEQRRQPPRRKHR